jgi:hypothetical protein
MSSRFAKKRPFTLKSNDAAYASNVDSLLAEYEWFLGEMDRDKNEALAWISDEQTRVDAFARGESFSQTMFKLVTSVAQRHGYARYLVI